MAKRERVRPISSYDEFLRRYLPDELEVAKRPEDADPAEVGEEIGRQAVEDAVAKLTASEETA